MVYTQIILKCLKLNYLNNWASQSEYFINSSDILFWLTIKLLVLIIFGF